MFATLLTVMKKTVLYLIFLVFVTNQGNAQTSSSDGENVVNYDTTSLIVRFNHKLLDWSLVDNDQVLYSNVGSILNDEGKELLSEFDFQEFELESVLAKKVFPTFQTKDSISIGRQGQKVFIPPFWATFSLKVPSGVDFDSFVLEIKEIYPVVIYAHPNFQIELTSATPPNDTLYSQQNTIHDNGSGFEHIHVDSAWCVETGDRFIKVGIFDTGVDSTHQDLQLLTGRASNNDLSVDSTNTNILLPIWGRDDSNHGTKVAGIIGAKRNNTTGIAGIAGGDGSDTSGVSLLDFRFSDNFGGGISSIEQWSVQIIDAARFVGSYYDWTVETSIGLQLDDTILSSTYENAQGFGIHIGNHSYAYRLGDPFKNEDDPSEGGVPGGFYPTCNLCYESFLFSLQNGVINVSASGNKILETGVSANTYIGPELYPASYDDSWGIRVGSSTVNGDVLDGNTNSADSYFSIWADNVDVIAPGDIGYNLTTWSVQDNSNTNNLRYGSFNGTSSAAPHVSGVAALLLSHYNERMCYSNLNLDLADVEYILQESADTTIQNINSGGYNEGSGWGRVNAEKALDMIKFPELQIVHPIDTAIGRQTVSTDTLIVYFDNTINLTSQGPISSSWALQNERPYRVVRYKEQLTYNFGQYISDTTELIDTWVRHSQTNSLKLFEDTINNTQGGQTIIEADFFRQDPMAKIDSVINDSIIYLSGYYYNFISVFDNSDLQQINTAFEDGSVNSWYPINPFIESPRMAYSIYIRDTSLVNRYLFPCDSINELIDLLAEVEELNSEHEINIYPNPTSTQLHVELGQGIDKTGRIQLLDISGRIINDVSLSGNNNYTFDVSNLNSGVYLLHLVQNNGSHISRKWIKQ
ncbi:MAG: hypothetical protein Crog4KO_25860 [Crocinitomicaceae bacterium]